MLRHKSYVTSHKESFLTQRSLAQLTTHGKKGVVNMKYHYRSLEQELDIADKLQVINKE